MERDERPISSLLTTPWKRAGAGCRLWVGILSARVSVATLCLGIPRICCVLRKEQKESWQEAVLFPCAGSLFRGDSMFMRQNPGSVIRCQLPGPWAGRGAVVLRVRYQHAEGREERWKRAERGWIVKSAALFPLVKRANLPELGPGKTIKGERGAAAWTGSLPKDGRRVSRASKEILHPTSCAQCLLN